MTEKISFNEKISDLMEENKAKQNELLSALVSGNMLEYKFLSETVKQSKQFQEELSLILLQK